MKRRAFVLGLGLLGSLVWSAWVLITPKEEVVEATARSATARVAPSRPAAQDESHDARSAAPNSSPATRFELTQRPLAPPKPHNLFAAYTYEAPHRSPPPPPPEPPHAPPLPFGYAGRLVVDGRPIYLLLQAGAPISVTVGASVGEFKLIQAAPDQLVFLHGPTGQQVAMSLGSHPAN
ncbi:MAG TPA: hypothetical protein VED85_00875 [Burkholderiaceae bacterium]|nr:hypothetical protein [Burkholderiaceae bacterium]